MGFAPKKCMVITLKPLRACCGARINILLLGDGRFITISTAYIKKADAILVCYDVRSESRWNAIEEVFDDVRRCAPRFAVVLLVACCTDDEDCRKVSREEGEHMAQKHNALHVETSAKTGKGCAEAFVLAAECVLNMKGILP